LLNPARPDLSVRYNPFQCSDDEYMPVVAMIFGSFNLRKEFFAKHQLNYLADIVRVLFYTGLKFNFYDVLVMAMDERVMKEQVEKARRRIALATPTPSGRSWPTCRSPCGIPIRRRARRSCARWAGCSSLRPTPPLPPTSPTPSSRP
jgi:hypothetical protein